jgi:hypothetical protein
VLYCTGLLHKFSGDGGSPGYFFSKVLILVMDEWQAGSIIAFFGIDHAGGKHLQTGLYGITIPVESFRAAIVNAAALLLQA